MSRVVAAIDTSPCAQSVLSCAERIAALFGARVVAVHAREDGAATVADVAAQSGVELTEAGGPVLETIAGVADQADVAAVVIGARGAHSGPRPAGHMALELITRLRKPVVVVPPGAASRAPIARILTPLEGSQSSSEAIAGMLALAGRNELEIVVLHVHSAADMPPFADQPQHEIGAWQREFAARFVALPHSRVKILERVGPAARCILEVAAETRADLVVLGWGQDLSPGRARVVRAALGQEHIPVLLVPAP